MCRLVNAAYRGTDGTGGWTSEMDWVDGHRITLRQLGELLGGRDSWVLVGSVDGELCACVHLSRVGDEAHIGMLAVAPSRQGRGLGSGLLTHAECCARDVLAAKYSVISVLSPRTELIAYYQRRGYRPTGATRAYPVHLAIGVPRNSAVRVQRLRKTLRDLPPGGRTDY